MTEEDLLNLAVQYQSIQKARFIEDGIIPVPIVSENTPHSRVTLFVGAEELGCAKYQTLLDSTASATAYVFWFDNDVDAVAFKLKFGGEG